MVARTPRTSEQIRGEIEQTFGFFPPFFEPALPTPQVLESLWQQTLSAYVDNPLPALFKERLNASLSRFCAVPYCMVCHSSALRPLGMTARQVLTLLETPPPIGTDFENQIAALSEMPILLLDFPGPDSPQEQALLACATAVFLEGENAQRCQDGLARAVDQDLFNSLSLYLAYIKTCHIWVEMHPEVSYEADRRAQDNLGPLLAEEPALGEFFRNYQDKIGMQRFSQAERRDAEEVLRAAQVYTAGILESITDAFVMFDREWRFVYLNDQAGRMLSRTREELVGRSVWEEFPQTVGTVSDREYHRALSEGVTVSFEQFYPPLDTWFAVRAYPSGEGLFVFFQDITEQVKRRQREQFLAQLAERARRLTDPEEVIADAVRSVGEFLGVSRCVFADIDIAADTCTIPPDYCADASVTSMAGVFPISAFGPFLVGEYEAGRAVAVNDVRTEPVRVPGEYLDAYEAVACRAYVAAPVLHSTRLVSVIAVHSLIPRRWEPEEVELLKSVVERTWLTVEVTRQERALVREAQATTRILQSITDAFIVLDTEWRFTYVNDQAEIFTHRQRDAMLGQVFWDVFPETVGSQFEQHYRRAVEEARVVSFEEFFPPLDAWFEVRAYPSGEGLSIFFQNVTTRRRAEDERERLLAEHRLLVEREAVLNRIGQALRSSLDPETVQEAAVSLLGEALGADRCYFATYDLGRGIVTIAHDWHRADLPAIQGVYPFANTAEMYHELYQNSNASVIEDADTAALSAQTKSNMEGLGLRSRISVALVNNDGLMATLTAAMTNGPRAWTTNEVTLVEAIATQLRNAVEMARITQREHNIATQLQDALQPDLPGTVPGLALTKYYRPALAQTEGVGGDFYDVYAVEKGCTALVVGDLSGKGLAAAAQVSIVRNMLRAFLYSQPTAAEAVTELNRVLAENNLLTGFTTLFVGVYDSATRLLNYVNCGQEPALIRRESAVEMLGPTGPILGTIEGARYQQTSVALAPGDAFAIFTDGLTEVGASRREMLEVEGVAALLAGPLPQENAQNAVRTAEALSVRLIAGVDAFARSGVRDDMCLLVGVVTVPGA